MAQVKSGATTDLWTIDPTSKAGRVSLYDTAGTYRGPKATYSAATPTTVVVEASAAKMFFVITGTSASKVLRIQRIVVSGMTLTSVAYNELVVEKWSSAPSAGSATTLTQTPHDSGFAAATATLCQVYTAGPTEGTLVGTIASRRFLEQATTAAAAGIPYLCEFNWLNDGTRELDAPVLRTSAQAISVAFAENPATAVTCSVECTWTEE